MKSLILILAITLTSFTALSQNVEGTYANKWVSNTGEGIEYMLTIEANGHFTFNYTRIHLDQHPDRKVKVQGTWSLDGHLIVLKTNKSSDADSDIVSGLDLNKARYVSVSPRNPKFNLVKPSLKFYSSEVFFAKDMELIKTDESVSSIN
jgi:hypothetical protein